MYYKTTPLLAALDSLIESAHDRLTSDELQLLADIRTGIAETKSERLIEEHFIRLIQFLLTIKEYLDKIS
jgi:hypothetical protein